MESVEAFPVRVRMRERLVASQFTYPEYQTVLVRVVCDGETGWGEAMTRSGPKPTALLTEEYLGPMIARRDFASPRALWEELWGALRVRGHTRGVDVEALSGIEIAVQDACARLEKSSVAKLLSRKILSEVPAYAGSIFSSRGPVKSQVEQVKALDLVGAKVKVGFGAEKDFATLREARQNWSQGKLIADANGAYEAETALKVARKIRELKISWFEEPVPADDFEGYRKISRAGIIPLGAGEAWFAPDFALPIKERFIDVVEPSVSRCGGIGVAWEVSRNAAKAGIGFSPMVGMNSAISLAASIEVAAASESLVGVEFDPFGNPLQTELCPGFPRLRDGKLPTPMGVGLGLEVDMGFVKKNLVS